jgi:hypothetical protein
MRTRWHRRTLLLEASRSGIALGVAGLVSLMTPLVSAWQLLLLPLCLLFASHVAGCILRWVSEITIDDQGITVSRGLLPALHLRWDAVEVLEVRLFPLGRYRKATMSDLKLKSKKTTLLIDDGVLAFGEVLARVWLESRRRGVSISDTTRTNLVSLGHANAGQS